MVRYPGGSGTSSSSSSPPVTPGLSTGPSLKSMNGEDASLFDQLSALHADEFAYLHKRVKGRLAEWEKSWWRRGFDIIFQYFLYVVEVWVQCVWTSVFFPLTLMDRISLLVMSVFSCAIMTFAVVYCSIANLPTVVGLVNWASKYFFDGVSVANAAYPAIFTDLKKDIVKAAREHLSQPYKKSSFAEVRKTRVFNLDAAKLLLQCAAVVYERTTKEVQMAAQLVEEHEIPQAAQNSAGFSDQPGDRIRQVVGEDGARQVQAQLDEDKGEKTIREIAMKDLGLQYYSVSELNTLGSSFCGLFWDPVGSFIIVAFKGTTPSDFMNWRTDLTFQMSDANQWLHGFGRVHDGFMRKIFPRRIPAGQLNPYDTIVQAIKDVTVRLLKNKGGEEKINIWFTGHSLGCALASVVYARMINELEEIEPRICVRDAYLFAAPIMCDVQSAGAFNNRMYHYTTEQKTMWRITNGNDIVASGLPDLGDYPKWSISPWNLLSFAHLGSEIKMRTAPTRCIVAGNHITPGTVVKIESACKVEKVEEDKSRLYRTMKIVQNLPVVGRIIAHFPGFYWASLMDVGVGVCEWELEF